MTAQAIHIYDNKLLEEKKKRLTSSQFEGIFREKLVSTNDKVVGNFCELSNKRYSEKRLERQVPWSPDDMH